MLAGTSRFVCVPIAPNLRGVLEIQDWSPKVVCEVNAAGDREGHAENRRMGNWTATRGGSGGENS